MNEMARRYVIGAVFAAALALGWGPAAAEQAAPRFVAYGVARLSDGPGTVVWKLVRMEARTLKVLRIGPELASNDGTWSFSPDRTKLAIGLQVFDLNRLRTLGQVNPVGSPDVLTVTWVTPNRLIAVVAECCSGNDGENDILAVLTVDPFAHRVVAHTDLSAGPAQFMAAHVTRTADGIAFLLWPPSGAGPTRLVLARANGSVRSVSIEAVQSGIVFGSGPPSALSPALAVGRAGNRAFVVGADLTIAEVNLESTRVSYHSLASASFSASKELGGAERIARYLPSGLLAVTGSDVTSTLDDRRQLHVSSTPAGLKLINTSSWTVRNADRHVSTITRARGLLLAYGVSRQNPGTPELRGMGLTAYSLTGEPRFHVLGSAPIQRVSAGQRFAYLEGGSLYRRVLDLAQRRIVKAGWIGPAALLTGDMAWGEATG